MVYPKTIALWSLPITTNSRGKTNEGIARYKCIRLPVSQTLALPIQRNPVCGDAKTMWDDKVSQEMPVTYCGTEGESMTDSITACSRANICEHVRALVKERDDAKAKLATAKGENEHLCNTVESTQQDYDDMVAGTLEGKLQAELAKVEQENKRLRGAMENAKNGLLEAQGSLSECGKDKEVNFDGYFKRNEQALKGE